VAYLCRFYDSLEIHTFSLTGYAKSRQQKLAKEQDDEQEDGGYVDIHGRLMAIYVESSWIITKYIINIQCYFL
jgi:hypothetical protein